VGQAFLLPLRAGARSEALEHIIMRRQEQVDALIRAAGGPSDR